MRWTPKPSPREGDRRVHQEFALFPVTLSDGDMIWLESYWVRSVFRVYRNVDGELTKEWYTLETSQEKP